MLIHEAKYCQWRAMEYQDTLSICSANGSPFAFSCFPYPKSLTHLMELLHAIGRCSTIFEITVYTQTELILIWLPSLRLIFVQSVMIRPELTGDTGLQQLEPYG
ncbi:hypothetical protein EJ05DRAFT_352305 [Pseudovirgaria hyperparasitica]|uniref:Uncharacterized protein n=1 Tax=Pseudovirgaria hyperparasitica TaxID=470096 RepID=A0A6A6W6I5_9PEZI|nr:uncharacterized protein EJ05DRAFT_352305 [Pseudovirgaria hyperparasitica]KAF2758482.1 hypothetical protein EJ05DRAFT_352305 [Pseudovirgaria hyperparasitica]